MELYQLCGSQAVSSAAVNHACGCCELQANRAETYRSNFGFSENRDELHDQVFKQVPPNMFPV